jgi:ABC-type multidrug transport system fused ATPase/permease subunit
MQLGFLLVVMLASGLAELLSLGAVLPFLAVLSNPDILWQQPLVKDLSVLLGVSDESQLMLPATMGFAAAAVLTALIRLSNLWLNGRLAAAVGSDMSCEAYRRTLYQPYGVHLQRNSAEVINDTTIEIARTVAALNAMLQLTTSTVVAAILMMGLLLIDAPVALSAAALFGAAYGVLTITSRQALHINGEKITEASTHQLKALQEGLGAIRDVLLDGSQSTYLRIYAQADRPQRQLLATNAFIAGFPRFSLEALGMVAIALLGGILVVQRGSGAAVIPLLGSLALGAQRLLPALQQIYSGWATLEGYRVSIQAVLVMLNQPLPTVLSSAEPLPLRESIRLEGVRFRYNSDQPKVLHDLNLQIRRGERVGLIGGTGSGKSTTVDLIMGLLEPTAGRVLIDGVDLHDPEHPERLAAWRASIAHVPQSVYLADSSIAENIAFGVPRQNIDYDLVKLAAARAQIASFIESHPEAYECFVGERGIRLSGGQRQRLGIARALYKKARVLVLDEATSALDTVTEERVMKSINALSESLTVIMIAHRLSTVESCDRVIRLEQGTVSADGPPQLVLASKA